MFGRVIAFQLRLRRRRFHLFKELSIPIERTAINILYVKEKYLLHEP